MNILILSVGTRNKIVQYFKKELNGQGKVIATDANDFAPALYEADGFYVVPKIDDPAYLDVILDICKKESINGILSLIDPELSLLSENIDAFINMGVIPIVSNNETVELSFDKYEFAKHIEKLGFNAIRTYKTFNKFYNDYIKGIINFPVFVKPITGSASLNIQKIDNLDQLNTVFNNVDGLIIQEYMDGTEFGVDVYIDMQSKEPVSIFIKEKILMRAGETDKSVSVVDEKLSNIIKDFLSKNNYKGVIDIDVFKKDENYYISEVNPRFGGGYPHAYEAGINIPLQIIDNLKGIDNKPKLSYKPGMVMMKYNEVLIREIR